MRAFTTKLWHGLGNRINPILLKEMRQGMRSKLYTILFLAIQVIMIFYLIFGMALSQGTGNGSDMDVFFWVILGFFLLVMLPLMATNALSSESRESRLDLLVLTRLSARRITYGKWFAVTGMGALIITSLLPYLVLRYYIGSVEFHESLLLALTMLLCSAIVTGIAVSLSVIKSVVLRWIAILGLGFWGVPFLAGLMFSGFGMAVDLFTQIPILLVTGGLVVALAMEFSAARISPIKENHDTPKRLILLAFMAGLLAVAPFDFEIDFAAVICAFCFVIVAWDGLCRQASDSPPVYERFVRFGLIGRMAGRLLYPGWLPSLFFSFLMFGSFITFTVMYEGWLDWNDFMITFIMIGVFTVPFAVVLYTPLVRMPSGRMMLLIQLCLAMLILLLYLIDEMTKMNFNLVVCWIPTSTVFLHMVGDVLSPYSPNSHIYIIASSITTAISLVLIAIKGIGQWRTATQMERQAIENIRSRKVRHALPKPPVLEQPTDAS